MTGLITLIGLATVHFLLTGLAEKVKRDQAWIGAGEKRFTTSRTPGIERCQSKEVGL